MDKSSSNLFTQRRKYTRIVDEEKRQKVSESNRRWRENNPEKKYYANKRWREKNREYPNEYYTRKYISKFGVPPPPRSEFYKFEQSWRSVIELEFPDLSFRKIRPDWLKNPVTGHNLELDMYCESHNLAIEISGEQHFRYTPWKFHRDYDDFLYQQFKDRFKLYRCSELGILLLFIRERDKPLDVLVKIHNYLDRLLFQ